jgi:hypothetical protein
MRKIPGHQFNPNFCYLIDSDSLIDFAEDAKKVEKQAIETTVFPWCGRHVLSGNVRNTKTEKR